MKNDLRAIPSVESLLRTPQLSNLIQEFGHALVVKAVRESIEITRTDLKVGITAGSVEEILGRAGEILAKKTRPTIQKVINATGVILHTNLGRAPLSEIAVKAMQDAASGYSSLEIDLESGKRSSRSNHSRDLICQLTSAEDALVVNNNAGAVLLCLSAIAQRGKVIISRSQLVEIGGGFRVPDVMKQSGAKLFEIGTTNKVNLKDYEEALTIGAKVVMRAHSSNFKLIGFTAEPSLEEVIALSHRYGVVFIDDLGSGALLDTSKYGIAREPMVQDSVKAGADLVCFSGDKLLGGPQSGIIIGKKSLVEKIKRHPLARAMRVDKLCLAGLSATLLSYLTGKAEEQIPVWRMMAENTDTLKRRANQWKSLLQQGEVKVGSSTIGGGSLPEETLPTYVFSIHVRQVDKFMKRLRTGNIPVIGRIQEGMALFDPRTVLPEEEPAFIECIHHALTRSEA